MLLHPSVGEAKKNQLSLAFAESQGVRLIGFGDIGAPLFSVLENAGIPIIDINEPRGAEVVFKRIISMGFSPEDYQLEDGCIKTPGGTIVVHAERDWKNLPSYTPQYKTVIMINCSGFNHLHSAGEELKAASKCTHYLCSGPRDKKDVDASPRIPYYLQGINADEIDSSTLTASQASCSTNSLAKAVQTLHNTFKIESAVMNALHSATMSDASTDLLWKKAIPGGSGALNIISELIPELLGCFDGLAWRLPWEYGSINTLVSAHKADGKIEPAAIKNALDQAMIAAFEKEDSDLFLIHKGPEPMSVGDVMATNALAMYDPQLTKVLPFKSGGGFQILMCVGYNNVWGFALALSQLASQIAIAHHNES